MVPSRPLWRLSLPPRAAGELAGWAAEFAHERLFDWAGGLVWLAPRNAWAEARDASAPPWTAAAATRPWCARPRSCAGRCRSSSPSRRRWRPDPAGQGGFDPQRILNPGRMYAGL